MEPGTAESRPSSPEERLRAEQRPAPADTSCDPVLPHCPITGRLARRRIQKVPLKLLRSLWHFGLGIDVGRLLNGAGPLGLYESECGLVFFHPMTAGDSRFYAEFYQRVRMHELLETELMARVEFRHAARHVPENASVLDVGCGRGGFRLHLPHARYRGLDPFAPDDAAASIVRETLASHIERRPEFYDVVTAFQVIEHLAEPRRFAQELLDALRPGGYLMLCAPLHPSPMTAIPNFLLGAPPHHLSWWNRRAFQSLADTLELETVTITPLPPSSHEGLIHWINRLSPCKAGTAPDEVYYAHRWTWHLSLAAGFALGKAALRMRRLPAKAQPINILLVARKPG